MTVVTEQGLRNRFTAVITMLLTVIVLAGCESSNRGVAGSVGAGTGVALATPGDITQLLPGQSIQISASVINDTSGQGVTWSLVQETGTDAPAVPGILTEQTATTVLFVATTDTTFQGATSATITATSKANPANASSVTIITAGVAKANTVQLFPAIVNIPYAAALSVSGGTAPFTWTLASSSAALPPGLVLAGSATAIDSISGTPTTAGVYSGIVVQVTDSATTPANLQLPLTITVSAAQSCIVTGNFALMVSGFRGGGGMTHVANINIDTSGVITGEQDYKDGHRTTVGEQLQNTSNCINRQTNSGQITLNAASGPLLYNFSLTPPDANGVSQSARLQLIGSGADSASGLMQRIDPTAINTASPPLGNFAFGLLAVQNQEPDTVHSALAGRFTTADTSGAITAGLVDSNAGTGLSAATLNGTLSAPDALGRGLATLTYGALSQSYVYYTVSARKWYLMNIDAQNVGTGIPRLSGFLTAQVPTAGLVFDNSAFNSPSVLSLWGAAQGIDPISIMTMGLLSSGGTSTASGGTVNGLIDVSYRDQDFPAISYPAQPFAIDPSGRGTLTLTDPAAPTLNYNLAMYLDGAGSGYVVQQGGIAGAGGLLEAQYAMPAGGFPASLDGYFVGGTQFAITAGPITLNPLSTFAFGTLASNFTNATFYVDQTNGRGFGTLTQSGVATQPATVYIVSPTKLDILRFGTRGVDGNIDWLVQNID